MTRHSFAEVADMIIERKSSVNDGTHFLTPKGCKAELTWVVVTTQDVYPPETITYLRK